MNPNKYICFFLPLLPAPKLSLHYMTQRLKFDFGPTQNGYHTGLRCLVPNRKQFLSPHRSLLSNGHSWKFPAFFCHVKLRLGEEMDGMVSVGNTEPKLRCPSTGLVHPRPSRATCVAMGIKSHNLYHELQNPLLNQISNLHSPEWVSKRGTMASPLHQMLPSVLSLLSSWALSILGWRLEESLTLLRL